MALESASYISGLVATNPTGSDPVAQADDHIRLIKSVLKTTFPNLTGAVSSTHTQLNQAIVPSGGIIMWSGAVADIPAGWLLCDGTNSTPDLRGKFVVGAGGSYAVGASGGANSVTLVEANLPAHSHAATSTFAGNALAAHSHGVTDPGHTHSYTRVNGYVGVNLAGNAAGRGPDITDTTSTGYTGLSVNSASAGTPSGTVTTTISNTGSGTAIDIRNPYYALCYIMKV